MARRIPINVTDATVAQARTQPAAARAVLADPLVALPPAGARRLFKLDGQRKDARSARNLLAPEGAVEQFLKEIRGTRMPCEADGGDWAETGFRSPQTGVDVR